MEITVQPDAKAYMLPFIKKNEHWLIVYEKAGCVCAEEGIFALRLVHKLCSNWQVVPTSIGNIYITPQAALYLDSSLSICYQSRYCDLSLIGKYAGTISSHFIIQNEDGSQRHIQHLKD